MFYFVVIYDFDGKNKATWVPKEYIYEADDSIGLGSRKYIYYHREKNIKLPRGEILMTLKRDATKFKNVGFFYPATIISKFGKYIVHEI